MQYSFVVISLDNEIGRRRRDGLGLDKPFIWSRGVFPDEIPDFVKEHWHPSRYKSPRRECLMAAFAAHLRVWRLVASMGSPPMTVLEDDAKIVRPIPEGLPEDTVTLLGGVFKGFCRWNQKAEQRAYAVGGFLDELVKFSSGINEIPTRGGKRMRWVMAVAYHLPAGMAAKLVDVVEGTKKKTLRTPDVWLNSHATHFVWPPPFVDQALPSQCMTPAKCHGSDFYCDGKMLHFAKCMGREIKYLMPSI